MIVSLPALAVAIYRHLNPSSRLETPCRYVRNSGTIKQRGCALCGCRGPTWCARYLRTRRAVTWEVEHTEQCSRAYVDAHTFEALQLGCTLTAFGWVEGEIDFAALAEAYRPSGLQA